MDGVDEDAIAGGVDGSSAYYLQGTQGGVGNGNLAAKLPCLLEERENLGSVNLGSFIGGTLIELHITYGRTLLVVAVVDGIFLFFQSSRTDSQVY